MIRYFHRKKMEGIRLLFFQIPVTRGQEQVVLFCHFAQTHGNENKKKKITFIYQLLVSQKCESWNNCSKKCAMVRTQIWNFQTQEYEEG
jgi:hypothetical protein